MAHPRKLNKEVSMAAKKAKKKAKKKK